MACLAQCAMSARPNEPPALTTAHLKWYAWSGLGRLLGTAVSTLCNIILQSPYHVKFREIDQRDSVEQVETMLPFHIAVVSPSKPLRPSSHRANQSADAS